MSNDGRTFFTTTDALVAKDTNDVTDVYEYVDGRPQLITAGTGSSPEQTLSGVTADGVNVYFGTYDTLVSQDHNGAFFSLLMPAPVEAFCLDWRFSHARRPMSAMDG